MTEAQGNSSCAKHRPKPSHQKPLRKNSTEYPAREANAASFGYLKNKVLGMKTCFIHFFCHPFLVPVQAKGHTRQGNLCSAQAFGIQRNDPWRCRGCFAERPQNCWVTAQLRSQLAQAALQLCSSEDEIKRFWICLASLACPLQAFKNWHVIHVMCKLA